MSWKRSAFVPALMAAALMAGCGSSSVPAGGRADGGPAPIGPAGTLKLGATAGHLGDATTDTSGGRLRRLSPGGPVELTPARPAPNAREGVDAADACPNAGLQPDGSNVATIAEATLCLLNAERTDRGLSALRLNNDLQRAALAHGGDMVDHLYFSHSGRDGSQPAQRIRAAGYLSSGGAWHIGENLAWGTGDLATPTAIMSAWMHSPGHRANILQPDYREIGFGVIAGNPDSRDTGGATYVTEFGVVDRPRQAAARRPGGGTARRAARSKARRVQVRRARARRARRARVALAPRSRRGRVIGRVASVRGGLG